MTYRDLTRIEDIKSWRDATPLDAKTLRAVNGALASIEDYWRGLKREKYRAGLRELRDQHDDLISTARFEQSKELNQLRDDLRSGRLTAADARGRLREFFATHTRLTEVHAQLNANDAVLEKLDAQTLQEYQDANSFAARFGDSFRTSMHATTDPKFGDALDEHVTAHRS